MQPEWLLSILTGFLSGTNLLLWRFLDFASPPMCVIGLVLVGGLCIWLGRQTHRVAPDGPTLRTLALCFSVSLTVYLLGGEGRLFYANVDWQVRDAVLHDLVVNPWPFAYAADSSAQILRAPIGMFLLPALVGKLAGETSAQFALLIQNSLLLTLILGLGSLLFARGRDRLLALVVILGFSGMDIVGQAILWWMFDRPIDDHIEGWAGIQFSSHVTQAFWVPQHAMAGWIGALLFLLWRKDRISVGVLCATIPLTLLLSPLGAMGVLPFAAYAGLRTLIARKLHLADILLPLLAVALVVPTLAYLGAAGENVGFGLMPVSSAFYFLFIALEALPLLLAAFMFLRADPSWTGPLTVVTVCLIVMPLVQIGQSADFGMRASITALAILSVITAELITWPSPAPSLRKARIIAVSALLIGSVTPLCELRRAVAYRPTPRITCDLRTAWSQVVGLNITSQATYFAPVSALPVWIRPATPRITQPPVTKSPCWNRPWLVQRFSAS